MDYAIKVLLSALLIVAASEAGKRSTLLGAALAALPLTSLFAMLWLYRDTGDAQKVADMASGILWFVLPSFALFLLTPWLIRQGVGFFTSLGVGTAATVVAYLAVAWWLKRSGLG